MSFLDNRWMRAAVPALLIHCSIGTVYCWSSFSAALADQIGTTPSVIGWAFSLAIFFLGMSAAFAGRFVERDIHKSSLLACICFTAGMVGTGVTIQFSGSLGTTATVLLIFLFYGCIMGIGLGIGYLTPVKTLMLWFSDRKGLATGISIMGFGLAKAIASPIMNALQLRVGLANMFYILSAVYFVMMMTGHFLLKKPAGWVEPHTKSAGHPLAIFKNRTFTGIWIMFYINITCGLALISYEKPILQIAGFGVAAISIIQSLTAASNALGRIGFSTVSDWCRDRDTIYKIIFLLSLGITILAFLTHAISGKGAAIVILLMLIVNAGYGGGFSTLPALLSNRFGMKNISEIHGVALSAWAFAGLSGNQITAFVFRRTGNYDQVLPVLFVLYLIAFLISAFLVNQKNAVSADEAEKATEESIAAEA
ncbi:MAG: OFA family MFS transporter [Eubacteriales bacterium]|nr:OFA family MFS transporter [Eubacteriales bacterium]